MSGSLILYRRNSDAGYWLVDARVTDAGDLVVASGDHEREWLAIVRKDALPLLVSALPGSYPPWVVEDVLPLLADAFPRDDSAPAGPFEAIRRFLDENAVPWESQAW